MRLPLELRGLSPASLRLNVDAIRIPGATAGQTLVAVVGPDGRVEFRPGAGGGGGGGIPGGTYFSEVIALPIVGGDFEPADGDPWFDVGAYSIVPSAHEVPGAATTALSFAAVGQTTRAGLYGDVRLRDLTNSTTLGSMSFNDAGWDSGTVSVAMPPGTALLMLQARARAPGGVLVGDFFNLRGAHLHIVNTF